MIYAMIAFILIEVAIFAAAWWWLHLPTDTGIPTEEEANRAIVDSVKASLYERPDQWAITLDGLMHAAGTEITMTNKLVAITHGGARSILPPRLAEEIIRAAQVRNAKMMLKGLGNGTAQ